MRNIIYISLIIIALSKVNKIEFAKEIPFDINNNEFELTFSDNGTLFISVTFEYSYCLNLTIFFKEYKREFKVIPPGISTVVPFVKNYNNKIKLEYNNSCLDKKGLIWMNPSTNEIKVNLNQAYEWKYDYFESHTEYTQILNSNINKLTYSIDNARNNALLKFKYNDRFTTKPRITLKIPPNPLKVCHKEQCKNKITTYEIKKGESYKIYVNVKNIKATFHTSIYKYNYILPSFQLNFTEEQNDKNIVSNSISTKFIAIFIIVGILLIIGLGIGIYLICRKTHKANEENHNIIDNIEFELDNIGN